MNFVLAHLFFRSHIIRLPLVAKINKIINVKFIVCYSNAAGTTKTNVIMFVAYIIDSKTTRPTLAKVSEIVIIEISNYIQHNVYIN